MVAALLIGAVLGAYGTLTWNVRPSGRVVTGVVGAIDDTAAAIRLSEPAELTDTGLGIAGVLWRDGAAGGDPADAEWQRGISEAGFPTCLTPWTSVGRCGWGWSPTPAVRGARQQRSWPGSSAATPPMANEVSMRLGDPVTGRQAR
ncbi:hypothetical protein BH23ACT9_BH23ACT9_13610 [soil metagenome]